MKRPKPVRSIDDALTWLAFGARFIEGDTGKNMAGCLAVLHDLLDQWEETQERAASLAKRLETLEAKGESL